MYNIIRKHSEDSNWSIVATAENKAEARKMVKNSVAADRKSLSTFKQEVNSLGDVTNVKYIGAACQFNIGYWFEKVETTVANIIKEAILLNNTPTVSGVCAKCGSMLDIDGYCINVECENY